MKLEVIALLLSACSAEKLRAFNGDVSDHRGLEFINTPRIPQQQRKQGFGPGLQPTPQPTRHYPPKISTASAPSSPQISQTQNTTIIWLAITGIFIFLRIKDTGI